MATTDPAPTHKRQRIAAETAVWGTFGAGLTLLGIVVLSTYASTAGLSAAIEEVELTRQVSRASALVLSEFRESQSERRAYLLTADDFFLGEYARSMTNARRALGTLNSLTGKDPTQRRRVRTVIGLLQRAESIGRTTITEREQRGIEAAAALVRSRVGHNLVGVVERELRAIESAEEVRLRALLSLARRSAQRSQQIAIVAAGLAILLVSLAGIIIRRDVAARRERNRLMRAASESAQAATRAKSDFLASMSHEIRTPLNGVIGMTELALDTNLTPRQREYLLTARASAESLLRLINDILDFSKIEAGRLDLDAAPFTLRDLLADTLRPLSLRAQQKGLELAYRVQPAVPDSWIGDAGRLQQVIVNLVGNAIKFTERGEIAVLVELELLSPSHGELHFSVRDTGIGIPPERHNAVFELFTQADGSTTRKYGGTGLGLTISQQLVELMGGRIWLVSDVGKGSTFHFTTRLRVAQPAAQNTTDASQLEGMPVLVVEDNDVSRAMLEETLASWRLQPTSVATGADAMQRATATLRAGRGFRVALIDSELSDTSGVTLAAELAHAADIPRRAIILLSGDQSRPDSKESDFRVLLKPVKRSELLDAIVSGVVERRVREQARSGGNERWKGARVLVVEDNEVNQQVARGLLERRGIDVSIAANGQQALDRLSGDGHADYQLVFMDVEMPEMDGLEATRRYRRMEDGATRLPIVALTAHAMAGDREECIAAGMDLCLTKPLRAKELDEALTRYLGDATSGGDRRQRGRAHDVANRDAAREARLLSLVDHDRELLAIIVGEYQKQGPRLLHELRTAIAARDAATVSALAHRIKGSLLQVGGDEVAAPAGSLEQDAREGKLDDAEALFSDIERFSADVDASLRRIVARS